MPIKRRKNLPLPPAAKATFPGDQMRLPGVSLEQLRKEALVKASDAFWSGHVDEGHKWDRIASGYQLRIDNGEVWEISH